MGVKVMNGEMPVESMLMQSLVSWESVDNNFRLTVKALPGSKKSEVTINFGTVYGTEICETMLTFAKELAKVKKQQATERKAAEAAEKERKAEMEAELEAAIEDEPAADAASAWAGVDMAGEKSFEVTQTHWKGKKMKGKKISETVTLSVSQSSIKVLDAGMPIESYLIQNLMSWETVENKFRLTLKPEKTGGTARHIDFGTPLGREITETLLSFAKDLARVKKQQKAEKKQREEEAAAAAKLAAKLAPKAIAQGKLEEVVTNLYLETFVTWRNENCPSDPFTVFTTPSIRPMGTDKQPITEGLAAFAKMVGAEDTSMLSVWAMAKSSLPDCAKLIECLHMLAWSTPEEGKDSIVTTDDLMLMMNTFSEANKMVEGDQAKEFAETAALALCTICEGSPAHVDMIVSEGGVGLALNWMQAFGDSMSVCRMVSTLLALLMDGKDAAERLGEVEGGFVKYLDCMEKHTPVEKPPEDDIDSTSTLYQNYQLLPSVDILEKLSLGLYRYVKKSAAIRIKAMEDGVVDKVMKALKSAPTPLLCARLISGVLNVLIEVEEDDDPLAEEIEEDVEGRLQLMIDADLLSVLVHCMQHNMSDFGLAGTAVLIISILRVKEMQDACGEELATNAGVFVTALERFAGRGKSRGPQPFALALMILAVGRMAFDPDSKESFVSLGVITALLKTMNLHKKERMVAESVYIAIHAMTDKLPDDVHLMLPGYMGIRDDAEEEVVEEADGEEEIKKYKVIRKAALRADFDLESKQVGILEAGDVIDVLEKKENDNGQMRVKCERTLDGVLTQAWTSVQSRDGNTLMVRETDDSASEEDKLLVKAKEVVTQLFLPLKKFPKDESMSEAALFAARTLLSKADLLKKATGRSPALKLIIATLDRHYAIPGIAENACATIMYLTKNHKENIKKIREAGGVRAIFNSLEQHQGNLKVCKAALGAIKNLVTSTIESAKELNRWVLEPVGYTVSVAIPIEIC